MPDNVTLFLPGLLTPRMDERKPQFPAISTLLSKATWLKAPESSEEIIKFFFPGLKTTAIPEAALTAFAQGMIDVNNKELWCQVAPIACHLDAKAIYILGNDQLNLTDSELEYFFQIISSLLKEQGFNLKRSQSLNWIFSVTKNQQVVMNDLLEAIGKNMGRFLPSGPDQGYWCRLLTECQMVLSQCPINVQRIKEEKATVSSIWLWGLGQLPGDIHSSFASVYSPELFIQGLTKIANASNCSIPSSLERINFKASSLIADLSLSRLAKYQRYDAWLEKLQHYEQNWFIPLLEALRQRKLSQLQLFFEGNQCIITKRHLKYFWRKNKSFNSFF